MRYEVSRISVIGNRASNQDRVSVMESDECILLVLGDGLGGKAGGALAAQMLIDTARSAFKEINNLVEDPEKFLIGILKDAHENVIDMGKKNLPPLDPGTTAVVCLIQNEAAWWTHIGDSRFYLFRDGLALHRTRDDSYVEKLYQQGRISLDKRDTHPMRNYVTQCLGHVANELEVYISEPVELQAGDVLLLCSDGFWDPLDDVSMGATFTDSPIDKAIEELVDSAQKTSHPTSDNISVIGLNVISPEAESLSSDQEITQEIPMAEYPEELKTAISDIKGILEKYQHEMDE